MVKSLFILSILCTGTRGAIFSLTRAFSISDCLILTDRGCKLRPDSLGLVPYSREVYCYRSFLSLAKLSVGRTIKLLFIILWVSCFGSFRREHISIKIGLDSGSTQSLVTVPDISVRARKRFAFRDIFLRSSDAPSSEKL